MGEPHTEVRMAILFLLVLCLLGWQATRLEPLRPPPIRVAADPAHQIYPVAVPPGAPPTLPSAGDGRRLALERLSVAWPSPALPTEEAGLEEPSLCHLFVPVSPHHWVRRPVPPDASRDGARWAISSRDLLDDDDGDGDLLDAGELVPALDAADGAGRVAEIHCPDAVR